MNIELHNFKSWEYKKITIQPSQVTLLKGDSGSGKTTIFEAVEFAIYGNGFKIIRVGSKSCKVILTTNILEICRTKGPNILTIQYEGNTYKDKAAQEIIYKIYGENKEGLSHMKQNSSKSFINLSPNDKFNFVSEFIPQENINKYKQKTKKMIQKRETNFRNAQSKVLALETILDEQPEPEYVSCPPEYDFKKLEKINQKLQRCLEDIKTKKNMYNESILTNDKIKHIQENINEIQIKHSSSHYEKKMGKIKPIIQDKTNKIELLKEQKEMKDLGKEIHKKEVIYTQNKKKYEDCKNTLKDTLWVQWDKSEIKSEMEKSKQYAFEKQKLDTLQKEINNIDIQDTSSFEERLKVIDKELMREVVEGKAYSCPGCKKQLFVVDSHLVEIQKHIDKGVYKQLKSEKKEITNVIKKNEKKIQSKVVLQKQYNELKNGLCKSDYDYKTLEKYYTTQLKNESEYNKYIELLRENEIEYNNIDKQTYEMYIKNNTIIEEDMDVISEELNELKLKYRSYKMENDTLQRNIQKKQILEDKLKSLTFVENIEQFNIDIVLLEDKIKKYNKQKDEYHQLQIQHKDYEMYKHKIDEFTKNNERYKDAVDKENHCSNELTNANILWDSIKQAESDCMKNNLRVFEQYIQKYLDEFFEKDSMKIVLHSTRKTKTGEKSHIELLLYYNGIEYTLNMFSGGEMQRLIIACNLGLNEMSNTEFILMDECTSNLDQDTTGLILNGLKKYMPHKTIIMIAHQVIDGLFDHTIEV